MSKLMNKFKEMQSEMASVRAKFQEQAQEMFKEVTKEVFEKNPVITAIIWTQYTPYFNDGDPCKFSVHEPYFTNANEEQMEDIASWGDYEGEDQSVFSEGAWILAGESDYAVERRKGMDLQGCDFESLNTFNKMMQSSEMKDVMLAMFGDHVRVVATRDGFDVEDHDHD